MGIGIGIGWRAAARWLPLPDADGSPPGGIFILFHFLFASFDAFDFDRFITAYKNKAKSKTIKKELYANEKSKIMSINWMVWWPSWTLSHAHAPEH